MAYLGQSALKGTNDEVQFAAAQAVPAGEQTVKNLVGMPAAPEWG